MKNTLTKIAGVAAVALALVSAQAAPISGQIGFTGRVGLNTGSAATATAVTSWITPTVSGTSGSFTGIANGTSVFIVSPWSFNSGAIAGFWSVGGFTFNLISSSITGQGGTPGSTAYVNVSGTGIVSDGNSANDQTILWNFSTQDPAIVGSPSAQFTFSASNTTIPDGGATIALLGLALTGAGMLRKKLVA